MASIDRIYRSILVAVRFFSKGWGPIHAYESLARFNPILVDRDRCAAALEDHSHNISLTKTSTASWGSTFRGKFCSPTTTLLPDMLPQEAEMAEFELLLPSSWKTERKPIYIHLAGTGDHGFYRRRHMTALPLLKREGIGALLLENPFYGNRKPLDQTRSQLLHVSDLFTLGLSLMLECLVLKKWLEGEGLGPVGLTGISMGGHNASLSAAVWPDPVAVVPCLSWSTASSCFTQGLLSSAVSWDVLEEQLVQARSSSDKTRKDIFDFAIAQQSILKEKDSFNSTRSGVLMMEGSSEEDGGGGYRTRRTLSTDCCHSLISTKKSRESSPVHWDTVSTLRAVLDLSTHLYNYPLPLNTNLAEFVVGNNDLYIPQQHVASMQNIWPGCEVLYVDGGHISTTILKQKTFQSVLAKKIREVDHK